MAEEKYDVLIIGSGGREAALVWWLKLKSQRVGKIYCAPGNPGISRYATCVPIGVNNFPALAKFADCHQLFTVVGPEEPLAAGIADYFWDKGLPLIGPSRAAALIESDKIFALKLMRDNHIPTGWYRVFPDFATMLKFSTTVDLPIVVKNPFLAAGKGAFVCETITAAGEAALAIKDQQKKAGQSTTLLVMEYLQGQEASLIVVTDGENFITLPPAQDYKHAQDDDLGPMTGGMGAYAPAPIMNQEMVRRAEKEIIAPTLRALREAGRRFTGFLYAGLMITKTGPKVVEFNCRAGDPETQVILPLILTDPMDILEAVWQENIANISLACSNLSALGVVLASNGYPGNFTTGYRIEGHYYAEEMYDVVVFPSGVGRDINGRLISDGGRVLTVTSLETSLQEAQWNAYDAASCIVLRGSSFHYRLDIGDNALKK